MALWARLLRGLTGAQLQKLLDCLHFEENGQRLSTRRQAGVSYSQDLPRLSYLYADAGNSFCARILIHGIDFATPRTTSRAVAAYYHSAVVELKRLVQEGISANPFGSLEDAIIRGLSDLDTQGLTCPLSFCVRIRRFGNKDFRSSTVDDIHVALTMRQESYNAASAKALKKLKEKWTQMAGDGAEKAQGLRPGTVWKRNCGGRGSLWRQGQLCRSWICLFDVAFIRIQTKLAEQLPVNTVAYLHVAGFGLLSARPSQSLPGKRPHRGSRATSWRSKRPEKTLLWPGFADPSSSRQMSWSRHSSKRG